MIAKVTLFNNILSLTSKGVNLLDVLNITIIVDEP